MFMVFMCIYVPGTRMTPVLIGKGLVLEGWSPKIEEVHRFRVNIICHRNPLDSKAKRLKKERKFTPPKIPDIDGPRQRTHGCFTASIGGASGEAGSFKTEHLPTNSGWWFQIIIFYVHPYLGKWSILTNIFQRGWNHQLELVGGDVSGHILTTSGPREFPAIHGGFLAKGNLARQIPEKNWGL